MLGWPIRDLVSSFSGRIDALLASIIGLLTVLSWALGDDSPLDTLDHGAQWFGVNISNALTHTDSWLNADHRQAAFIAACLIVFCVALFTQFRCWGDYWQHYNKVMKRGLTDEYERYVSWSYRCEVRFWSIAWVLAGVAAMLHAGSWGTTLACFVAIAVLDGIFGGIAQLLGPDPDLFWSTETSHFIYGVVDSFTLAVRVLAQLPVQLHEAVFVASVPVNHEKRAQDSDQVASQDEKSRARSSLQAAKPSDAA
jgi:hypothetical protein